jgi:alkylated DNA nucleotide flippase Atl1
MPKPKKTWKEKLEDDKGLPKTAPIPEKFIKSWGTGTFVIGAPREVNALMQRVRKGRVTTINDLREALARKHGTSTACPITTGIFAWIAAHAAGEAAAGGAGRITPYWRTLKIGGELNPKYPGGIEELKRLLEAEGHTVVQKGKRNFVKDFEKKATSWEDLLQA